MRKNDDYFCSRCFIDKFALKCYCCDEIIEGKYITLGNKNYR